MTKTDSAWIHTVSLPPPTLQDNTADADRLVNALKIRLNTERVDIRLGLLKPLPALLRQWDYQVRCIVFRDRPGWLLAGIVAAADPRPVAGLAVDLGTTRVVLRLLDLATGKTLAESAFENPQMAVGPDILARLHYAEQPKGLARLNRLIIAGLNQAIAGLCSSGGLDPDDIYALSVAGNTAMTHLFMALDPGWMIREPYIPVVNKPGLLQAAELGLEVNPGAGVFIFPNVGSYFGGDLIAGILFSKIHRRPQTAILVDVGTNAEVVLGNENWLIACAGAAGPALEGGMTPMGMTAGPGVIDRIEINRATGEFTVHTIENEPPIGICGSGVIDLAAQLFLSGMIDMRGTLVKSACGEKFRKIKGLAHLVVVPAAESGTGADLCISQADLDSLIRSKAAMYTILETITSSVGIEFEDLATFYVAGTFGAFINPQSAIAIGMLPDLPLERYQPLGNSCLGGATLALQALENLTEVDRIRDRITYLELNVNQEFMHRFSAAKFLPHTDPARFKSVSTWIKR